MNSEGDPSSKKQQPINEGIQSLADMPSFYEREMAHSEKQEELHKKECELHKLCDDARDSFLRKHFKNSIDYDFRSTYNSLSESGQERIEHYRFFEDAEALLDHNGDAYKNIVETYYNSHYEYQPGSSSFKSYHDYTRSAAHGPKNQLHLDNIRHKWYDGYKNNSFGSKKLKFVMEHFVNTAEEIFGEDTEEYCSILDEVCAHYSSEESRPLEMFYKLKLKEFNDRNKRKELSPFYEEGHGFMFSFGSLLDVASDKFDKDSDVVVRYGDIDGEAWGSGYDGEENNNKRKPSSSTPLTQNPVREETSKPESIEPSFADNNGFRDW